MNTREKFHTVKDALNANGQLELMGEPRLEGTVYEISNLPQVKDALDAWDSFPWSETPQDLREDIAYLASMPSVQVDHFNRMQNRLRTFSDDQLVRADPMAVLEDAVADFGDELFQLQIRLEDSIQLTLERGARSISLPEALIVEGHLSEPRFSDGSLDIFWSMAEESAKALWTLAMYCWQEVKALLADPATSHVWSVFDNRPENDPDTVRNMKRDYIQKTFGVDDTLTKACEAANVDIDDVKETALKIASIETKEDVTFQWPLSWRRQREHTIHGISLRVRSEPMVISESSAETILDMIKSMSHEAEAPDTVAIADDAGAADE